MELNAVNTSASLKSLYRALRHYAIADRAAFREHHSSDVCTDAVRRLQRMICWSGKPTAAKCTEGT